MITLKEKLINQAVIELEELINAETDTQAEYHTYLAVIRERLEFNHNRMTELGVKLSQVNEV